MGIYIGMDTIYLSLGQAREKIKKRCNDAELKRKNEAELGEKFPHELFESCQYDLEKYNNQKWIRNIKDVSNYYYLAILHFLAHEVLFGVFFDGDSFTNDIIIPNFEKIKEKFGVAPVIVRLYPDNQNEEEDFYWRSCPPGVNETIIKYANSNNLNIKIIEKNNKQNLTKKTNYNKL